MKILKSNRRVIDGHVSRGNKARAFSGKRQRRGDYSTKKNQSGVRVESFQQDRPVRLSSPACYALLSKQPKASK
jgi:hypothetical protein